MRNVAEASDCLDELARANRENLDARASGDGEVVICRRQQRVAGWWREGDVRDGV